MNDLEEGIRDKSVAAALRRALTGNSEISEKEVKDILKSTLDGKKGARVSDDEYHDLMMILRKSKSLSDQSRILMTEFIGKYYLLRGPYIYTKVEDLDNKPKVFSGECAGIVQWYTKAGLARSRRQGISVKNNGQKIKKGTAIATFVDGFYPNMSHGNHAALYISQNARGIIVMDQWNGPNKKTISRRELRFLGKNADGTFINPSNNADAFSVIMTR